VRNVNVTWSVTSGEGTLSKIWNLTDSTGIARTNLQTTKNPGTTVVAATNLTLAGSPTNVTIVTVPSYTMTAQGALPTTLPAGNSTLVKVLVLDQKNAPTAGVRINWSISAGGGSLAPASSLTGADGIAHTELTTGLKVGNNVVLATNASLVGSPLNQSVRTVAGPPVGIRFASSPTSVVRGAPFTVTVELIDQRGNLVTRTGTVSIAIGSGTTGQLNGTLSRAWNTGAASFNDLRLAQAGIFRLLASFQGLQNASRDILVTGPSLAPTPTPTIDPEDALTVPDLVKPFFVPDVEARRLKNGSVLVNWSAPSEDKVGGFLVWRAASPFTLLAQLEPENSSFVDASAQAGHAYRYAVTFYREGGDGFFEVKQALEGLSRDAEMPTSAFVDSKSAPKSLLGVDLASWNLWIAVGALLVAAVGVAFGLVAWRRSQSEFVILAQDPGPTPMGAPDPGTDPQPRSTEEQDPRLLAAPEPDISIYAPPTTQPPRAPPRTAAPAAEARPAPASRRAQPTPKARRARPTPSTASRSRRVKS
jgi:hypothetical protein